MQNKYRVIVFDWESTLAEDFIGHVAFVIENELQNLNINKVERSVIRNSLEQGLPYAIGFLFDKFNLVKQEEILFKINTLISKPLAYVSLMPGAFDLVQNLYVKGFDLAIATNKGHSSLSRVLALSKLDEFFKVTCSAGDFPAKPCPDMLIEIMHVFTVASNEILMIGDSVTDIEMAKAAGVDAIGLDVYHNNTEELRDAGALHVFDDFRQIADFLCVNGE
jgi:phosphoglycolate phosphatase